MRVAMDEPPEQVGDDPRAALFSAQQGRLRGLAYRFTGSVEDADDVVQESFVRLLERAPDCAPAELPFWLVRVVTNLSLDALRRRKRRAYAGPWLPAPLEGHGDDPRLAWPGGGGDIATRYDRLESATFAFLIALEALGPRQRAVLLLRDVVGAPVRDTATVLGISEANVRVLHLRARRAMAAYDRARCLPTAELRARHRAALEGLLAALLAQDVGAVEAWLADSVRTVTDAAGEYTALAVPLTGRTRVARFYLQATRSRQAGAPRIELRTINGLPAILLALGRPVRRQAPRSLLRVELDGDGRIAEVQAVLAPRKLAALTWTEPGTEA
jgi:RNA polymerase sigma-70 factor (ECF subfamily)